MIDCAVAAHPPQRSVPPVPASSSPRRHLALRARPSPFFASREGGVRRCGRMQRTTPSSPRRWSGIQRTDDTCRLASTAPCRLGSASSIGGISSAHHVGVVERTSCMVSRTGSMSCAGGARHLLRAGEVSWCALSVCWVHDRQQVGVEGVTCCMHEPPLPSTRKQEGGHA